MNLNPAMASRIELWPIEKLTPYVRNARTHSEAQVAQIAASIAEFGFNAPILVDGTGEVIAGHGRLMASKKLGLSVVPVVVLDHLTPIQRRAYLIADNRLAESAGWDQELLAVELSELSAEGLNLSLLGFDDEELASFLNDETGDSNDSAHESDINSDDDIPEPPVKPVSRTGDIWCLGKHRLACGDAGDSAVITALMNGERADICFTSPPYGQQRNYTQGIDDWDVLMKSVFAQVPMAEMGQVLVNLGLIHRDNEFIPYWNGWLDWMCTVGWRRFGWYIWDQGPGLPGDWNGRLAPAFEFVFHFNRQGSRARQVNKTVPCIYAGRDNHLRGDGTSAGGMRNKDGSKTAWNHVGQVTQDFKIPDSVIRVMRHKGKIGQGIDHPAVFPVALPEHILLAYSEPGEIIFEPFGGSGTTILATQRTDRVARAVEIAPEYTDVAIKRFQQNHPDIPVTLLTTGQTFDEVATERLEHHDDIVAV